MRHVRSRGCCNLHRQRVHTQRSERAPARSGVAWPHSLQMNPCRSRCASARTQVSTDGVSISPLHMYLDVLLGVARERLSGRPRVDTQERREPIAAPDDAARGGVGRLRGGRWRRQAGWSGGSPLRLEHTRMVGRQQPHPFAALELRLLRKLALGGVLDAPVLARIVASACQPEDQCRFRQARLRKLAKQRDAAIGRVEHEHAHKVKAPRVPYDIEIGHPSVGIDDLPVIHCQEASIYLTLLALHTEARVDSHTASSDRLGPSAPPVALSREQSSCASCCTQSEGYFVLCHRARGALCWRSLSPKNTGIGAPHTMTC
eukprot:scaffold41220_cov71-Phaeocystis_antarctica.AAC.9